MVSLLLSNIKRFDFKIAIIGVIFWGLTSFYLESFYNEAWRQWSGYNSLNVIRFGTIGSKIFELPFHLSLLPRAIFLIFTPVPNLSSVHQAFLSLSSFFQVFSFPFLLLSLASGRVNVKLKLTFLMFFFGVALSSADFRHVMMFLPFGIILTVIGFHNRKKSGFGISHYTWVQVFLFFAFTGSIVLAFIY
jgi:hypothetical protein